MAKQTWKAGNMLYPLPAVMVSVSDKDGKNNIITVAWAGTICTNPPMVSISVRPERYSYHMIDETGEFVINLTNEDLAKASDYCGVRSGRDVDKFKEMHLTPDEAQYVKAPLIKESPVNIECRVVKKKNLVHIICFWQRSLRFMWMMPTWTSRTGSRLRRQSRWFTSTGSISVLEDYWELLAIV